VFVLNSRQPYGC